MACQIGYTQHKGKNRQFPLQQDAIFTGKKVLKAQIVEALKYYDMQDCVTIAIADGVGKSPQAKKASLRILQALKRDVVNKTSLNVHLMGRLHLRLCD